MEGWGGGVDEGGGLRELGGSAVRAEEEVQGARKKKQNIKATERNPNQTQCQRT